MLLSFLVAIVLQDGPPPPWSIADVDAYVLSNKPAAAASDDPFTAPPAAPPPAERIVLRAPVVRRFADGAGPIDATWAYDAETQQLTLRAEPESGSVLMRLDIPGRLGLDPLRRPRPHQMWLTHEAVERSDGGRASNAYGVTVDVRNITSEQRGITQLSSEVDGVGPAFSERYGRTYEFSTSIAPDEARALVARLSFEVEAISVPWSPGKWVICGLGGFTATVRTPINSIDRGCFLTTEIIAVRFVDTGDGRVIREWVPRRR